MFIFLDVDGVLNNLKSLRDGIELDDSNTKALSMLVSAVRPQIILSSTWRLFHDHRTKLKDHLLHWEIPLWMGMTPDMPTKERWNEIEWSIHEKNVDKCIIIDDDQTAFPSSPIIPALKVKTDFRHGLTLNQVMWCIEEAKNL